jgi:hypothetical protein
VKIEVNEDYEIILKEVFTGIGLETKYGEKFGICMRDSGFEFEYAGVSFQAKDGVVTYVVPQTSGIKSELVDDFSLVNVYHEGDYTVFHGEEWIFHGKVWMLENGHTYTNVNTIGIYPSENAGWQKRT